MRKIEILTSMKGISVFTAIAIFADIIFDVSRFKNSKMLKKGEYHYARDAKKHEAKLAAYKKM